MTSIARDDASEAVGCTPPAAASQLLSWVMPAAVPAAAVATAVLPSSPTSAIDPAQLFCFSIVAARNAPELGCLMRQQRRTSHFLAFPGSGGRPAAARGHPAPRRHPHGAQPRRCHAPNARCRASVCPADPCHAALEGGERRRPYPRRPGGRPRHPSHPSRSLGPTPGRTCERARAGKCSCVCTVGSARRGRPRPPHRGRSPSGHRPGRPEPRPAAARLKPARAPTPSSYE